MARGKPSKSATARRPDLAAMQRAVGDFLAAAGLDAKSPDLAQTPALVARAWADDFLDGYRTTPSEVLAEKIAVQSGGGELVVVRQLDYVSVCPHHLLPYAGVAHLGYVPGEHVVGFGQLARLVECLAHRLVLQEDLARQIADALALELGAKGAGVVLEAKQSCLMLRGERQCRSSVIAEAFAGTLVTDRELRERFVARAK